MSVATSRSEAPAPPTDPPHRIRVRGAAELRYARKHGATGLDHLYVRDPLKLLFPRPEAGEPPTAVVVTTSGGLVGGDELSLAIEVGAGADSLVTAQAAEKVYRSTGPDARVDVALAAGDGAWLEWLPQETILFEGARLRRQTGLNLAAGARALAGEILVFGRVARGEEMTRGLVRDAWRVRRDGRLTWADALHLDGDGPGGLAGPLNHPAGFAGARACATAVYAAPGAEADLDAAREILGQPAGVRAGVTAFPGLLVARFLAVEPLALRRAFAAYWAGLRHRLAGRPARLPRLWQI
ncbi:MAG: urease accessory protein UreD [Hyphomicrobiales bacterium]|nr:urease accessory protein UreD [Hyphomicrobiales bacterium]MCP5371727.1 urease accessory protein UreD [Hyphomicrobiales bacterium]